VQGQHYTSPSPVDTTHRLQRFTIVTAAMTLLLIAVGGAVRATDSGLACPTWPGCFYAGDFIPPADLHVWLEHTHRLVAGVVGLLIAGVAAWSLSRFRGRRSVLWPALAALVLVVAQSVLGAVVVFRFLQAELVTAHLGLAMVIVALLIYLSVELAAPRGVGARRGRRDLRLPRFAAVVAGLCYLQILVGGHVTGIGAGLVYTDFPLMGGAVLPAVASEREAFHVLHRLLAGFLALAVVALYAFARRTRPANPWLVRLPALAVGLVVVQVGLGAANLWNGSSFVTVIPHLAVASWIWATLVLHTLLAYRQARPLGAQL
jgi:heme a synthase